VTLFDVYECAISPSVLEKKLKEAERRLGESDSVLVSEKPTSSIPVDLEPFEFRLNTELACTRPRVPLDSWQSLRRRTFRSRS